MADVDWASLLRAEQDGVLATMLSHLKITDVEAKLQSECAFLQAVFPPTAADTCIPVSFSERDSDGVRPNYSFETISASTAWLAKLSRTWESSPQMYSVVRRLLWMATQSPFSGDKDRLLVAAAFAFANEASKAASIATSAAVLRFIVGMLEDEDEVRLVAVCLAHAACKSWTRRLPERPLLAPDLCKLLLEAAHLVHAKMGAQLLASESFRDSQVIEIKEQSKLALARAAKEQTRPAQSDKVKETLAGAIDAIQLLWPVPSGDLAASRTDSLRSTLSEYVGSPGTLELLHRHVSRKDVSSDADQALVWRTLRQDSWIRKPGAVDTIAKILSRNEGRLKRPALGDESLTAISALSSRDALLTHIVQELGSHDQARSFAATQALMRISARTASDSPPGATLGGVLVAEVEMVQRKTVAPEIICAVPPVEVRNLAKTLSGEKDDDWLALSETQPQRWLHELAVLLCEACCADDTFCQSLPLVKSNPSFAVRAVGAFVHAALASVDGARQALSDHFAQVLQSPSSSPEALQAVVDISLQLRQHTPTKGSSDAWLAVPWFDVARAAMKCARPTTALLALELSYEYETVLKADNGLDGPSQDLLYDVYSQVDDPDAFYGLRSDDPRAAALRRHRHEGRWADAMGDYGATLESVSGRSTGQSSSTRFGVVESLAQLGFSQISGSLLSSWDLDASQDEQAFAHQVAWRTANWDFPTAEQPTTSDGRLYAALRSFARSVNLSSVPSIVARVKAREVERLPRLTTAAERLEAVSTILALQDIETVGALACEPSLERFHKAATTIPRYE